MGTPGSRSLFQQLFKALAQLPLSADEIARGALHLNGVNGWHSRFKTWLRCFHGVASRYLANYAGWQRVLDAAALTIPQHWLRAAVAPKQWR